MLRWAWAFLIVALIAAVFGFGGIASGAASIAKILFYLFLRRVRHHSAPRPDDRTADRRLVSRESAGGTGS
jgi:uncharacterized membrane protein YtjA (UPF0391 family)